MLTRDATDREKRRGLVQGSAELTYRPITLFETLGDRRLHLGRFCPVSTPFQSPGEQFKKPTRVDLELATKASGRSSCRDEDGGTAAIWKAGELVIAEHVAGFPFQPDGTAELLGVDEQDLAEAHLEFPLEQLPMDRIDELRSGC